MSQTNQNTTESQNPGMRGNSNRENIESPISSQMTFFEIWERLGNVSDGNSSMNGIGQSDNFIVPATTANNGSTELLAESDEGRKLAKRNIDQDTSHRAQNRSIEGLRGRTTPQMWKSELWTCTQEFIEVRIEHFQVVEPGSINPTAVKGR